MFRRVTLLGLVGLAFGSSGCMTAVKQAYYGVRGAQGKFYEVQVVKPATLATYRSVRVESFTNELGAHLPAAVIREVNQQTPKAVADKNLFYARGKKLVVTGQIVHFTGKSALRGSVGSIIGGGEACVCRVQLKDADSGEQIGEAVCWGLTKSAVRRGSGELGIGVGKAVSSWISKRFPKEVKEARRRDLGGGKDEDD